MLRYETELVFGTLIRRYKRFLADVELENGEVVIAHCTNTGSMKSCIEEGARVGLTPVNDPKRKTKFTWEIIEINNAWIGINTNVPNKFAFEAVKNNEIPGLENYTEVIREVTFGDSRLDLQLKRDNETCFVEIKNVTYNENGVAIFPDAVSSRGTKHLNELMEIKKQGMRAVMLYIIQRMDVESFAPAWDVDPVYGETLKKAQANGVEILPVQIKVSPEGVEFHQELPYEL